MTATPRIAAIVPMRHSSERVPGKNYRDFAGKPLFHRVVESLRDSGVFDTIVIDTDSDTIRDDCEAVFPDVTVLERPPHLRAGETPMNEVLLNTVETVDADYYLQTHSTNPLLTAGSLRKAVETFFASVPEYDSLFSVTTLHTRLWDQLSRPINHNASILLRTQDLPPVFEENSCIYIFTKELLVERRNRIGDRPVMFPIDHVEAVDIDIEFDFVIAERMFEMLRGDSA